MAIFSSSSHDLSTRFVVLVVVLALAATALGACSSVAQRESEAEPRVGARVHLEATGVEATADDASSAGALTTSSLDASSETMACGDADPKLANLGIQGRACFARGLQKQPAMFGRLVTHVHVDASGHVVAIEVDRVGLSEDVSACITDKVKKAQFSAPGRPGQFDIPFTFVKPTVL